MTAPANKISPHTDSKSIVQRSMTTGVFASDNYIGDIEGFVDRVVQHWFRQTGESATSGHIEAAQEIFGFYTEYRAAFKRGLRGSQSVFELYKSGLVSVAQETLKYEITTLMEK